MFARRDQEAEEQAPVAQTDYDFADAERPFPIWNEILGGAAIDGAVGGEIFGILGGGEPDSIGDDAPPVDDRFQDTDSKDEQREVIDSILDAQDPLDPWSTVPPKDP